MGFLFSSPKKQKQPQKSKINKSKVQQVDIVKVKIKHARDKINQYINLKNKDLTIINQRIQQIIKNANVNSIKQLQTSDRKKLMPLLDSRKQIDKQIENCDVRMKALMKSLSDVEMTQLTKSAVDALQDSNKYIKEIQEELQKKDVDKIIQDASQKYQGIQWNKYQQDIEEDQTFKQLWKEIGGQETDKKQKIVEGKKAKVLIQNTRNNNVQEQRQKQEQYA